MNRIFNFSAGPANLPLPVLEQARDELLDWQGRGLSVMEDSHRGRAFVELAERSEQDLRALLSIPDDYAVLFMQGGATLQFATIPMTLAKPEQGVDYLITGHWGKKAASEAAKLRPMRVVADGEALGYRSVPAMEDWETGADAAYLHYTANETLHGLEIDPPPAAGYAPLVCDMSSTLLSRPIPVERFGLIYACAQKNIGPAGVTVVIISPDLIERVPQDTPLALNYRKIAAAGSMLNTPATFPWYMASLVFRWVADQGGLAGMAERNRRKADLLYGHIDGSDFYANLVDPNWRSWMNVPFTLAEPSLDAKFLETAEQQGLYGLKGHRAVGGMRASIYNAMPEAGVRALVSFMEEFERKA
ncbi:MAG: 3-phosphoserine/phosphohydroxythreonine transaminase [Gammaproteobacteria bacterium]|nr:3-phosphoserine/phosphohydroxythreonine transaminase [Gammaproteobacteria bacterium]MCY4340608.1 3-phosphoserine/phosphohydroxythreonine transaminase [Gammaproteobacteria bacterium]